MHDRDYSLALADRLKNQERGVEEIEDISRLTSSRLT
jgi:hypothetical protein